MKRKTKHKAKQTNGYQVELKGCLFNLTWAEVGQFRTKVDHICRAAKSHNVRFEVSPLTYRVSEY